MRPEVTSFFDEGTNAVCHLVRDPDSRACAVIDSILDFDMASGTISTTSADAVLAEVARRDLIVDWVLETHVHADHLSAMPYVAERTGGRMGIGDRIDEVQRVFGKVFNAGTDFQMDGGQFDALWADGDTFRIGGLEARVIHTPGHTPACVTYVIGGDGDGLSAFVGDTLFMPDYGTARCDFPGGSAEELYRSIHKVLALPGDTRLHLCHDYKAPGREEFRWETTVAEERASNVHVGAGRTQDEFVAFRTERDAKLGMPKLIIPSIQVNMRAERMPPPEADGETYLKIPIGRMKAL